MTLNHLSLRQAVIDSANFLVRAGAISMSHHGNFSVRVPGTETILLTATSSFDNLRPENLAVLDFDGRLLEGEINATNAEIVHMHAVVYKHRPETGAVVHTHSTYATSFALASRSLGCSYEALVRADMTDGVPLAHYGPRGSKESVTNIAGVLIATKKTQAVLLENHGVLAFGADPVAAARANLIVEEAAQMAVFAEILGGAKLIPAEMLKATISRRDEFAQTGNQRTEPAK
ncbi:MAG TPA: class II aldolase/adducin family protein [Candidatus Binatia bacterium]|nr:class II aldolase/adducin family protein [Candidatus Binatia bacterium]